MAAVAKQGAGLAVSLTADKLDQDFGSDAATIIQALKRFKARYDMYWAPYGTDPNAGYQALKARDGSTTAAADAATMGSAVTEMLNMYNIMMGNATIAPDVANGGNGVVTTGAAGSGHNFFVFMSRICGDSVS